MGRQQRIRKIYATMFGADPLTVGGRTTLHYVEFLEECALRYQEMLKEAVNNEKKEVRRNEKG